MDGLATDTDQHDSGILLGREKKERKEGGKKRPPAPIMRCFTCWILQKWEADSATRDQDAKVIGGQLRDRVVVAV